jgi:hypothetical protein
MAMTNKVMKDRESEMLKSHSAFLFVARKEDTNSG